MPAQITVTIPAIDEAVIAAIKSESEIVAESEVAAIQVLRQKYAPFARQNGYVRTGWEAQSTSNSSWEREAYYRVEGKRVRALLCVDDFDSENNRGDQNRGRCTGSRLYLLASGEWLEITRVGTWSQWQGEGKGWACGDVDWDTDDDGDDSDYDEYDSGPSGSTKAVDDEYVQSHYQLGAVVKGLSEALKTMGEKLPERLAKLRQRAELAQKLLASLA